MFLEEKGGFNLNSGEQHWVLLILKLNSYVTPDKLLNLSVPQFPYL